MALRGTGMGSRLRGLELRKREIEVDIPPYSIAAGNPARIIKQYDWEKEKWVTC